MNFERTKKKKSNPNIVPMIDVVFFLLVFFMLFTTIRTTPLGMDVELPRAVTGSPQANAQLEITVEQSGAFYAEGRMVTGPELRNIVAQRVRANPNLFVIVKADRQVRYEYVVNALDHVRAVGGHNLGLAVQQNPN